VIAAVFLFHGVSKILNPDMFMGFVGGVPHGIGLTFLPVNVWFWLAVAGEIFIGLTLLLGKWMRAGVVTLWIIMLFAMIAKKLAFPAIELDIVLILIGLALFISGPGDKSICGGACCGEKCAPAKK
jgi:uncharacterized membrane protein YphA (DoxX/SURF4 family)